MNSPGSTVFAVEACGRRFVMHQQPSSLNHGKVVWDGAIAMAKYFEFNPKLHSGGKLRGKKVLEVGSGCGLLGLVLASLGCDVVLSDKADVVPLLEVNINANAPSRCRAPVVAATPSFEASVHASTATTTTASTASTASGAGDSESDGWGTVRAVVFEWGVTDPEVLGGPFDYIFGSDVGMSLCLSRPALSHTLSKYIVSCWASLLLLSLSASGMQHTPIALAVLQHALTLARSVSSPLTP
jgi:hypothetical protein